MVILFFGISILSIFLNFKILSCVFVPVSVCFLVNDIKKFYKGE